MIEITEMSGAGAWLGVITSARHAASHHNGGQATGNIFQTMREIVLDTEPSSGRALGPIQISRAPFRASPLLRGKTRPQGASGSNLPQLISDGKLPAGAASSSDQSSSS